MSNRLATIYFLIFTATVTALSLLACQDTPSGPTPTPPPPPSVTAVPVNHRHTVNGFEISMGYRTDAPLVIVNVKTTWELTENGVVTRSAKQDYWEWFTPGTLPTTGTNWDPADWAAVSAHAGKKFIFEDLISAANGLVAIPPPQGFSVAIKRTHEFYTGGSLTGQGAGQPQLYGNFGYLAKNAAGQGPTATQTNPQGTTDNSQAWAQANNAQGKVSQPGTKVLTVELEHVAEWGQPAAGNPPHAASWTYKRNFGAGALPELTGSHASGQTPSTTP